jgi:hypothetical protein
MIKELTAEERLQAAINLQETDRIPSCPMIFYFAAQYAGISNYELWSDRGKYRMAIDKCYHELGPWDIYYCINPRYPEFYTFVMPMKAKWPGRGLPPDSIHQLLEEEIMKVEDYHWVGELAQRDPRLTYFRFFMRMISRAWDNIDSGWIGYLQVLSILARFIVPFKLELERWEKRGVANLYSYVVEAAFDTFSLARGLINFVRDLNKYPEEVKKAADELTEGCYLSCKAGATLLGVKRVEIFVHRSSNDFISPETFKEFSFPSLKRLAEALVAAGINPILHLDGNWDLNLETLRELPAGNCVVQFDGPTDIFLAKKVGKGGGYIMGAGCEIPPNARPENVKAMIDSVNKYRP